MTQPGLTFDTQPASVRGIARAVLVRDREDRGTVLEFRVETTTGPPVPVRMRYHQGGQIAEGDEVSLSGRWVDGTLETKEILNLTTGARVHGVLPSAKGCLVLVGGFFGLIALVGVVLAAVAFLVVNRLGDSDPPRPSPSGPAPVAAVTVPDVTGANAAAAAQTLRDAGLRARVRFEASDESAFGTVARTDPDAGATVERDSTVVVYVVGGNGP